MGPKKSSCNSTKKEKIKVVRTIELKKEIIKIIWTQNENVHELLKREKIE